MSSHSQKLLNKLNLEPNVKGETAPKKGAIHNSVELKKFLKEKEKKKHGVNSKNNTAGVLANNNDYITRDNIPLSNNDAKKQFHVKFESDDEGPVQNIGDVTEKTKKRKHKSSKNENKTKEEKKKNSKTKSKAKEMDQVDSSRVNNSDGDVDELIAIMKNNLDKNMMEGEGESALSDCEDKAISTTELEKRVEPTVEQEIVITTNIVENVEENDNSVVLVTESPAVNLKFRGVEERNDIVIVENNESENEVEIVQDVNDTDEKNTIENSEIQLLDTSSCNESGFSDTDCETFANISITEEVLHDQSIIDDVLAYNSEFTQTERNTESNSLVNTGVVQIDSKPEVVEITDYVEEEADNSIGPNQEMDTDDNFHVNNTSAHIDELLTNYIDNSNAHSGKFDEKDFSYTLEHMETPERLIENTTMEGVHHLDSTVNDEFSSDDDDVEIIIDNGSENNAQSNLNSKVEKDENKKTFPMVFTDPSTKMQNDVQPETQNVEKALVFEATPQNCPIKTSHIHFKESEKEIITETENEKLPNTTLSSEEVKDVPKETHIISVKMEEEDDDDEASENEEQEEGDSTSMEVGESKENVKKAGATPFKTPSRRKKMEEDLLEDEFAKMNIQSAKKGEMGSVRKLVKVPGQEECTPVRRSARVSQKKLQF